MFDEFLKLLDKIMCLAPITEQFGKLPHNNDQRDPVEIADQDRLREEACYEAESSDAGSQIHDAGYQGEGR